MLLKPHDVHVESSVQILPYRARSSVATGALLVLVPLLIVRLKQQQLMLWWKWFWLQSNYFSASSSSHIPSFPDHCKI